MSEVREVVITIKNAGNGGDGPGGGKPTPGKGTETKKGSSLLDSVVLNKAFDAAKQLIKSEAEYALNKSFDLNDDYVGRRNLAVAKTCVSKAVSTGMAAYSAIALGLGPAGVAVALGGAVASTALQIYQNYDREATAIRKQEAQLSFSRQRAGYSLTSGSIGEDR